MTLVPGEIWGKPVSMQCGPWRSNACVREVSTSAVFLLITLTVPFLNPPKAYAIPESSMLAVSYHAQETDYYCGPCSVQMVLEYITGDLTAQRVLAGEMGTTAENQGTNTNMMPTSFRNRGYSARERRRASVIDLKELNAEGYGTIINIHFDTDHKNGHYIVVVGYNETGIFVNDPWPTRWKQPVSRRTGNNAYLSFSLLINLWIRREYWMIEIPYRPSTDAVKANGTAKCNATSGITTPPTADYPPQPHSFLLQSLTRSELRE